MSLKRHFKNGVLVKEIRDGIPITENLGKTPTQIAAAIRPLILRRPQLPSAATQAKNLMGAAGKAILNPKPVSKEERERRLAICNACEFLIDGKRCQKCGCHVNWKSRLEAWHCPIEKW